MNKVMKEQEYTLESLYRYGRDVLSSCGIMEADTDAHILLEYAAQIDRSSYYLHMYDPAGKKTAEMYIKLLNRRAEREPVQYITGEAYFYGHTFLVTPDVLIPRQDTEILVAEAEKRLCPGMRVLDLCTGSGCVLLSILNSHHAEGIGSDISPAALAVAMQNQKRLGLQAEWIESDLFTRISGVFDMIVSNPPYIAADVLGELQPEVIGHEPVTALDGGLKGLENIKRIIREAPAFLKKDGWLLLEIGFDQGDAVKRLLAEQGFKETVIIKDLEHRERVAAGRRS